GQKDAEISEENVEGTKVLSGAEYTINLCGRSDSPSGSTGTEVKLEEEGGAAVCRFYWDCPWGIKTNTWTT
ncbi:hypothetical protein OBBRIDRAFT_724008, partial [Obba rivulosa]